MELRDTPDEAAFRQEIREFIAENKPKAPRGPGRIGEDDRDWSRKLGEAGYAGLTWPRSTAARVRRTAIRRSTSRSLRRQRPPRISA